MCRLGVETASGGIAGAVFVYMSVIAAAREIYGAGKDEFLRASLGAKALLAANVVGIFGEQFGGNEYLLGSVGGHVFEATHNVVLTAAAAGGSSFAVQAALGLATLVSIKQFPKTVRVLGDKLGRGGKTKASARAVQGSEIVAGQSQLTQETPVQLGRARRLGSFALRWGQRLGIVIGSGSSLKAIDDNSLVKHTRRENIHNVLTDAGLVAGSVAAIGAAAATGLLLGQSTGHEGLANNCVDIMTNPLPYVGLSGWLIYRRHRSGGVDGQAVEAPKGQLVMPVVPDEPPVPPLTQPMQGDTI